MDSDTLTLMLLLVAALGWWFVITLNEQRKIIRQDRKNEQEKQGRAERVRRLTNK